MIQCNKDCLLAYFMSCALYCNGRCHSLVGLQRYTPGFQHLQNWFIKIINKNAYYDHNFPTTRYPVWVPGLRIDPLRILARCRKRWLNQAPLNLCGLIWLLMTVWSKRGNINTAALVTIAQCNTLVARRSRQLIGPADWVFVTLGLLHCD